MLPGTSYTYWEDGRLMLQGQRGGQRVELEWKGDACPGGRGDFHGLTIEAAHNNAVDSTKRSLPGATPFVSTAVGKGWIVSVGARA